MTPSIPDPRATAVAEQIVRNHELLCDGVHKAEAPY